MLNVHELNPGKDLRDYRYDSFTFKCNGDNKKEIEDFKSFISDTQNKEISHIGLIFSLEKNSFFNYISICDCGHIEKYSKIKNFDDIEKDDIPKTKELLSKCPVCGQPYTDKFFDYEIDVKEEENYMSIIINAGQNEEVLKMDLYQYYVSINNDEICLYIDNYTSINFYKDKCLGKYNPLERWGEVLEDYLYEKEYDNYKYMTYNHSDVYESVCAFNPDFKDFVSIITNYPKEELETLKKSNSSYKNINETDIAYSLYGKFIVENIYRLADVYAVYCKVKEFIDFRVDKKFTRQIALYLYTAISKKDSYYSSDYEENLEKIFENISIMIKNKDLIDEYLNLGNNNIDIISKIEKIAPKVSFIKEIKEAGLFTYIMHYFNTLEGCTPINILEIEPLYLANKDNVSIEQLLKYIIRGSVNERLSIKTILSDINDLLKENQEISFKGAFNSKIYNRYNFFKKVPEEYADLYKKAENCNTLDAVYKLFTTVK